MKPMIALSVASEIYPLVKTGGLADVVGALPGALAPHHVTLLTLIPGYPAVLKALESVETAHEFPELFGGPARLLAARKGELQLLVLDAPHLYDRPGTPYVGPDGNDWPDNAQRFAALAKVGAELGQGLLPGFVPDLVHAHDWQAGLTAAYLHYSDRPRPGTVFTVHNLAFQGQFPHELLPALDLPPNSFTVDGVEYYGAIGFLKAGLLLSDRITTVSPSYALEIQAQDAGMGLDGLLRQRSHHLHGIINGIDETVWDPASDTRIPAPYSTRKLHARAVNKAALREHFGLRSETDRLLVGVISRLSWQKGLDMLLETMPVLAAEGIQLALLGTGDADLEAAFRQVAQSHPGQIGVAIGYDENLAHLIQAGADALLVPSRFEPCGLTQLCALRYGTVPVVARVGGLSDTVIDANEMAIAAGVATGVQFAPVTAEMLAAALIRTKQLYADRTVWKALQRNGMRADVSWRRPAEHYAQLYRELIAARNPHLAM